MKKDFMSFVKLLAAGIICFAAAYLSERTLGAVSAFPFIMILPGLAGLIYRNYLHLAGICAISAFILKCVFSSKTSEIIGFILFCSISAYISMMTFSLLIKYFREKKTSIKLFVFPSLFAVAVIIYICLYGTIHGNLASKKLNRDYLEKTYPNEQFLIRSTYYSFKDGCYFTEFDFTAKERYRALVSADKDGTAHIDGYRDLASSEILTEGLNHIRTALSTIAYEGSDYVIRNNRIDSSDILTSGSDYSEYAEKTYYEIALYYQFRTEKEFTQMCQSYIDHLKKYKSLTYGGITFYGFDSSENEDFSFVLDYNFGSDQYQSKDFTDKEYSRYFSEKDTHKYWELLG